MKITKEQHFDLLAIRGDKTVNLTAEEATAADLALQSYATDSSVSRKIYEKVIGILMLRYGRNQ